LPFLDKHFKTISLPCITYIFEILRAKRGADNTRLFTVGKNEKEVKKCFAYLPTYFTFLKNDSGNTGIFFLA
jgi:hypothetical protein